MGLYEKLMKERDNKLTKNVLGWRQDLSGGDYNAWDKYQPESDKWSNEEELSTANEN